MLYLCVVGRGDIPLFEMDLGSQPKKEDLNQFIVHAALDIVEQRVWQSPNMFMRHVDQFNDLIISAFVTASRTSVRNTKLMLLHDKRIDDNALKAFFHDAYETVIKAILDPFFEVSQPIESPDFAARLKHHGRKHLLPKATR